MTGRENSVKIGEAMRLARHELGLSQLEVAEQLGIRQSYLSKVETDTATPSIEILRKLCKFYGVKADRLLLKLDHDIVRRNATYRAHVQRVQRRRHCIHAGALSAILGLVIVFTVSLINRADMAPVHQSVTLTLDEVDGGDAIDLFAAYGKLEISGRDLVQGKKVSIKLRDTPWDEAFAELANQLGVRAEFSGGMVELKPAEN